MDKNCAQHGQLSPDQIYVRNRDGKTRLECRPCNRAASLRHIPRPCAIHGPDPSDGWTKKGECKACRKAYLRQYRKDRPERCAGYETARDPEARKAHHRKSHHKRRDRLLPKMRERGLRRKIMVVTHYSGGAMKCALCPESRLMALAVDHVNGRDGTQANWGGTRLQSWLVKNKYPTGYQILCHNCNSLKSWPTGRDDPKLAERRESELRLKKEVISHYSAGTCKCDTCGADDLRVLNMDHVNGGGTAHRKSLKVPGGVQFCRKLKQAGFPEGFQVLCFSCNLADYLERRMRGFPELSRSTTIIGESLKTLGSQPTSLNAPDNPISM